MIPLDKYNDNLKIDIIQNSVVYYFKVILKNVYMLDSATISKVTKQKTSTNLNENFILQQKIIFEIKIC